MIGILLNIKVANNPSNIDPLIWKPCPVWNAPKIQFLTLIFVLIIDRQFDFCRTRPSQYFAAYQSNLCEIILMTKKFYFQVFNSTLLFQGFLLNEQFFNNPFIYDDKCCNIVIGIKSFDQLLNQTFSQNFSTGPFWCGQGKKILLKKTTTQQNH